MDLFVFFVCSVFAFAFYVIVCAILDTERARKAFLHTFGGVGYVLGLFCVGASCVCSHAAWVNCFTRSCRSFISSIVADWVSECISGWKHYYQLVVVNLSSKKMRRDYRVRASRRAKELLKLLDLDASDEKVVSQLEGESLTVAALRLAQEARVGLSYPTYSKANEKVVCHWLQTHAPEAMGARQRARIFPLAIQLTFVKSKNEIEAEHVHNFLSSFMEVSK